MAGSTCDDRAHSGVGARSSGSQRGRRTKMMRSSGSQRGRGTIIALAAGPTYEDDEIIEGSQAGSSSHDHRANSGAVVRRPMRSAGPNGRGRSTDHRANSGVVARSSRERAGPSNEDDQITARTAGPSHEDDDDHRANSGADVRSSCEGWGRLTKTMRSGGERSGAVVTIHRAHRRGRRHDHRANSGAVVRRR